MTSSMTMTQIYEDNIKSYAQDPNPQVAAVGAMGQTLLWGLWSKTSRDSLVSSIYWKVKSLVSYAGYGWSIDIDKARKELEEEIERAN
ncbi:hypothetical protein SMACR_07135 [Sordaria macrospora]|uniref:WGS project CABT00000000 data, contig 2.39 n=2 Tax=Sordaria macrospora TaxID=5147 RepID=F7W7G0_SORMK|nr:uncharacterized protein SMAC_07135 [Sordaria macrospora k-hell]KAA8633438.1 hypothetical protein SMACR_07135 [Sordaria macrospora]KAH7630268.1 hypothetical protein B0T09DRAFT_341418 [Sordaria sp. MPI-SDFR-AT-0083]WPJ66937.1 hypothetical protein SMAC4_07135 [Sordaria macrospora]CCC13511.1 unnamed protein product [Sordaria macrospora k-hell]